MAENWSFFGTMEAKCNIADVVISPEINHQKNTLRSLINVVFNNRAGGDIILQKV